MGLVPSESLTEAFRPDGTFFADAVLSSLTI